MKVVKEFSSRMDAEIAKGFLESSGIGAFITSDTGAGGIHPELADTYAVKLSVSDVDYEKAREILDKVEEASPLLEIVDSDEE